MAAMEVTIELRYTPNPRRPAAGWWLGEDLAMVVREVTNWPGDQQSVRWFPCGLVVPAAADAHRVAATAPPGAAFGLVGDRLWVPCNAEFDPPRPDREVAALLPADEAIYVWRPGGELLRVNERQVRSLPQCLPFIAPRATVWDAAQPGLTLNSRLVSIEANVIPNVDEMLREARTGIGAKSEQWEELPVRAGEPTIWNTVLPSFLRVALSLLLLGFVAWAIWMMVNGGSAAFAWWLVILTLLAWAATFLLRRSDTKAERADPAQEHADRQTDVSAAGGGRRLGAEASNSGVLGGIRDWARRQTERWNEQLNALRNREIERLLSLLHTRPDEGLEYALPLRGDAGYRGRAAPSTSLARRSPLFDLSRLFGGSGPADLWSLGHEYHRRLRAKYEELARREVALGRFRRAAYIYAELLGDIRGAAAVLMQGHHYRDAAALYDQKLKDSRAAAKCLEQGGLLAEAAVVYHGLGDHEKVGEIYRTLDREELAVAAFRRAVEEKLRVGDSIDAARLLTKRLHDPEAAEQVLWAAWPDSPQAAICLRQMFRELGDRAEHERTQTRIHTLSEQDRSAERAVTLMVCFAEVANSYPDSTVQLLAADKTRVLGAFCLRSGIASVRETVMAQLRRLAPGDQLLHRDCERYQRSARRVASQRPSSSMGGKVIPTTYDVAPPWPSSGEVDETTLRTLPSREKSETIRLVAEFSLSTIRCQAAAAVGRAFLAVGYHGNTLRLTRGLWNGEQIQEFSRTMPTGWQAGQDIQLEWAHESTVYLTTARACEPIELPASDHLEPLRILAPPGRGENLTATIDRQHQMHVLFRDPEFSGYLLGRYSPGSSQLDQVVALKDCAPGSSAREQLFSANNRLYLVMNSMIHEVLGDGTLLSASETAGVIWAGRATGAMPQAVLGCHVDRATLWPNGDLSMPGIPLRADVHRPLGTILSNGNVILAVEDQLLAFHGVYGIWLAARAIPSEVGPPVAIVSLPFGARFAVFARDGRVRVYELAVSSS